MKLLRGLGAFVLGMTCLFVMCLIVAVAFSISPWLGVPALFIMFGGWASDPYGNKARRRAGLSTPWSGPRHR